VVDYAEPKSVDLKTHAGLNERWVQARGVDNPSLLGLGNLDVKDQERRQPRAGRLDLLLQDPESNLRNGPPVQVASVGAEQLAERPSARTALTRPKRQRKKESPALAIGDRLAGLA
jgi:hypothetical protein